MRMAIITLMVHRLIVHVALTALMDSPPDLIVSGINQGQNMGDDTLYSGTVAAATEGLFIWYSSGSLFSSR